MAKQTIIAGRLKELKEERWENFKKALCKMDPPGKVEPITMQDLRGKSVEDVVDFIFRCYTERHGKETIIKVLKNIKENQMRIMIERDVRQASKSKAMKDTVVANEGAVSSSEPPAQQTIRQQHIPGVSHNIQQSAYKKGGPKPATQGTLQKTNQNAAKKGGPGSALNQPIQEKAESSKPLNTVMFISEIQARPALHDTKHPDYNNNILKKKLWEEVAMKMFDDWETLDSEDKEEKIIFMFTTLLNLMQNFQEQQIKQGHENEDGSAPSKKIKYRCSERPTTDQSQTSLIAGSDCEQADTQRNIKNDDDRRWKETQAAANKTKKSTQDDLKAPNQNLSKRLSQGNVSNDVDNKRFLLSLMDDMKAMPPEKKHQLRTDIRNILKTYSLPNLLQPGSSTRPMQMANNPASSPSNPTTPRPSAREIVTMSWIESNVLRFSSSALP